MPPIKSTPRGVAAKKQPVREAKDDEYMDRIRRRAEAMDKMDDDDDDDNDDEVEVHATRSTKRRREAEEDEDEGEDEEDEDEEEESENESDDDDDPEDEEEGDEALDEQIAALEQNLADIPMGELQALKGKLGLRAFKQLRRAAEGSAGGSSGSRDAERRSKNSPMVQSSKKPVSMIRDTVAPLRARARDPRFEKASGHLNEELFRKSYGFIRDMREKEIKAVRRSLKRTRDPERRQDLQNVLSTQSAVLDRSRALERERAQKAEYRKTERELVKDGKKPYFMKKTDERKVELVQQYEALKKSGRLDKTLEKRARRQASKDHRFMPYARREAGDRDA